MGSVNGRDSKSCKGPQDSCSESSDCCTGLYCQHSYLGFDSCEKPLITSATESTSENGRDSKSCKGPQDSCSESSDCCTGLHCQHSYLGFDSCEKTLIAAATESTSVNGRESKSCKG